AAGEIFLDKILRECLSIIESKSKVRYSRSRVTDVRENANALPPSSSHSNSFDLQQIAASLEDKLDIRMNRFEKSLNDMKNSFITPNAPLKAVEEIPRECLSIIESKSKVRYSRSRVTDVRGNANDPLLPSSSHSNSFDLQQIAAALEDKLDIRMNRFEKSLNDMKNSFITPTAPLKALAK
nr:hypothetical protein [Tanacetum cinerariifolium]